MASLGFQQHSRKKIKNGGGGCGGRRKKTSQRIKNKSTEGSSSSSSSLSRPRRLKGQRSETAGPTYLVSLTLVQVAKADLAKSKTHVHTTREESQFKVTQDNNNWLSRCLGFGSRSFRLLAEFLRVIPLLFFILVKTSISTLLWLTAVRVCIQHTFNAQMQTDSIKFHLLLNHRYCSAAAMGSSSSLSAVVVTPQPNSYFVQQLVQKDCSFPACWFLQYWHLAPFITNDLLTLISLGNQTDEMQLIAVSS